MIFIIYTFRLIKSKKHHNYLSFNSLIFFHNKRDLCPNKGFIEFKIDLLKIKINI